MLHPDFINFNYGVVYKLISMLTLALSKLSVQHLLAVVLELIFEPARDPVK